MDSCPVCHQEICLCGEPWQLPEDPFVPSTWRVDGTAKFKIPWYRYVWARFRLWLSETGRA